MAQPVQPAQKPSTNAAPKPATKPIAAAKAPATRRGKPTQWRRWAEQAIRFANLVANLKRLSQVPVPAAHVANLKNLSECIPRDDVEEDVAILVASLHRLDADQVPVPKAPKAPRFISGDKVKIVKKFCLPRYLAFATEQALQTLEVVSVAKDGHQFLCETEGGDVQIHIIAPKHLEKR